MARSWCTGICKPAQSRFSRPLRPTGRIWSSAVECIFTWYWLADLCAREGIPFVLGHALYMKAIHGGKAKNDKIDAQKIAVLLRGGHAAHRPMSIPRRCGPPGTCSGAACI